jgi:3-methyl-2-oxobutanoate hydroxymethyltransferase
VNTKKLFEMKGKEKIAMLTAYDSVFSSLESQSGIDLILVGDSVANVMLGQKDTKTITLNEMLHHVKAVCNAKPSCLVVADMPINSYSNPKKALSNAKKFLNAGANAVKLEGTQHKKSIEELRKNKVEVMGHIGLTPQTAEKYCVQGKNTSDAEKIFLQAKTLDSLGCFSIVLECIPQDLAERITKNVSAPTIGIGAGPECDGQVLVINDLLGLQSTVFRPKFLKQYRNLREESLNAIKEYIRDVKQKKFPAKEHSYFFSSKLKIE